MLAVLVLLLALSVHAQDSQFLFDPNGNLLVQTAEVSAPPQILGQPQNRIVVSGESASFSVVAADTRLLAYQWRFNGTNVTGATNDAVVLQNVSTNSEGEYRVVLTNPSGSITSAPALLMIDSDADGLPDSWEQTYFGNLTRNATADSDGDGNSNLAEFLDDTNPTNIVSARYRLQVLRDGGAVIKTPDQASYTNGETVTLTAVASANDPFHAWLGDIVRRSNTVTLMMTNNKTVYARFTPVVFTWTNQFGGNWESATNWTPNLAPGLNDSVLITNQVTVSLNASAECADVSLGSPTRTPTLTVNSTLTIGKTFLWDSGTINGNGQTILQTGAALYLTSPSPNGVAMSGHRLENRGSVFWTGPGGISLLSGVVITNCAGALFEIQNNAAFDDSAGFNRFDNVGTFRKSGSSGTTSIGGGLSFNNSGAVEIQSGTLIFDGGFTNNGTMTLATGTTNRFAAGGSSSGAFSAPAAALVEWTGGTFSLNPGAQLNGAGVYKINNGGTLTGGTDLTVDNLDFIVGTLSVTGTVTIANTMNWTGGTMSGSGRTIIRAGATLNVPNPSGVLLNARTLENGGVVNWTGAGSFALNSGAIVTNRAGALFYAQNAASFVANVGVGRFDNAGTFRKSISTGATTIGSGVSFTNSGTVDIRSGILAANGGYTSTSNALLNCALGGTTPGTGYGQLQAAGAVTLNGALSVDFTNGFTPALNDSFTVLTAGTRDGTFVNFSYPSNSVTMQLSNAPTSVIVFVSDVLTAIPPPLLLPPELIGPDIKLRWTAVSNAMYRLEFNSNLNSTNWNALPGDVTTLSNTASKLDARTSSNRLYRVRVLP